MSGPPPHTQPAFSSNHHQRGVKLQLKWEEAFSPNANVHICWCRRCKHDISSLSKWMHAWRLHYGSTKMSSNKHDNNPTRYKTVPAQEPESLKGQHGTESLTAVPGSAPWIQHSGPMHSLTLPFILTDFEKFFILATFRMTFEFTPRLEDFTLWLITTHSRQHQSIVISKGDLPVCSWRWFL